jgi:hypothetical protein
MIVNRNREIKYLNALPVAKDDARKVSEMQANHKLAIENAYKYLNNMDK